MKVAFRPPATATPDAAPRVSRAQQEMATLIASLVRSAPDGAAGWARLMVGVDVERNGDGVDLLVPVLMSPERLAANDAAMKVDHEIGKGWVWLEKAGERIPHSWVERLCELHADSLDRLAELDDVRRREAEAEGKGFPGPAACMLSRASQEADAYLRGVQAGPTVEAALELVGRAIDAADPEAVATQAKRYVREAVLQRYGARIVEDER